MSMTKITLSAPPEVAAMAKEVAAVRHTSVSALFATLIRAMHQASHAAARPALPAPVAKLVGCARDAWPSDWDDAEIIRQAIHEKYEAIP